MGIQVRRVDRALLPCGLDKHVGSDTRDPSGEVEALGKSLACRGLCPSDSAWTGIRRFKISFVKICQLFQPTAGQESAEGVG